MRRMIALLAIVLAGCGGDGGTSPQQTSINGHWEGTADGIAITLFLQQQTGSAVTGTGRMGSLVVSVDGTYNRPTLSLNLRAECCQPTSLLGNRTSSSIRATLHGSGWEGETLVLTRP